MPKSGGISPEGGQRLGGLEIGKQFTQKRDTRNALIRVAEFLFEKLGLMELSLPPVEKHISENLKAQLGAMGTIDAEKKETLVRDFLEKASDYNLADINRAIQRGRRTQLLATNEGLTKGQERKLLDTFRLYLDTAKSNSMGAPGLKGAIDDLFAGDTRAAERPWDTSNPLKAPSFKAMLAYLEKAQRPEFTAIRAALNCGGATRKEVIGELRALHDAGDSDVGKLRDLAGGRKVAQNPLKAKDVRLCKEILKISQEPGHVTLRAALHMPKGSELRMAAEQNIGLAFRKGPGALNNLQRQWKAKTLGENPLKAKDFAFALEIFKNSGKAEFAQIREALLSKDKIASFYTVSASTEHVLRGAHAFIQKNPKCPVDILKILTARPETVAGGGLPAVPPEPEWKAFKDKILGEYDTAGEVIKAQAAANPGDAGLQVRAGNLDEDRGRFVEAFKKLDSAGTSAELRNAAKQRIIRLHTYLSDPANAGKLPVGYAPAIIIGSTVSANLERCLDGLSEGLRPLEREYLFTLPNDANGKTCIDRVIADLKDQFIEMHKYGGVEEQTGMLKIFRERMAGALGLEKAEQGTFAAPVYLFNAMKRLRTRYNPTQATGLFLNGGQIKQTNGKMAEIQGMKNPDVLVDELYKRFADKDTQDRFFPIDVYKREIADGAQMQELNKAFKETYRWVALNVFGDDLEKAKDHFGNPKTEVTKEALIEELLLEEGEYEKLESFFAKDNPFEMGGEDYGQAGRPTKEFFRHLLEKYGYIKG